MSSNVKEEFIVSKDTSFQELFKITQDFTKFVESSTSETFIVNISVKRTKTK